MFYSRFKSNRWVIPWSWMPFSRLFSDSKTKPQKLFRLNKEPITQENQAIQFLLLCFMCTLLLYSLLEGKYCFNNKPNQISHFSIVLAHTSYYVSLLRGSVGFKSVNIVNETTIRGLHPSEILSWSLCLQSVVLHALCVCALLPLSCNNHPQVRTQYTTKPNSLRYLNVN